jgi:hypothetical protein
MPRRSHHLQAAYRCPTAVYLILTPAGPVGDLHVFGWHSDVDAACERAAVYAGVVVQLPVVACHLPGPKEWNT